MGLSSGHAAHADPQAAKVKAATSATIFLFMIPALFFVIGGLRCLKLRSTAGSSNRRSDRMATDRPERERLMSYGGFRGNCGSVRGGLVGAVPGGDLIGSLAARR
jgi:hypothetical protein